MTSAIYDFKALKAATLAFPEDRPQNVVKPSDQPVGPPPDQSHIYDYADGAFPVDYSGWAKPGEVVKVAEPDGAVWSDELQSYVIVVDKVVPADYSCESSGNVVMNVPDSTGWVVVHSISPGYSIDIPQRTPFFIPREDCVSPTLTYGHFLGGISIVTGHRD